VSQKRHIETGMPMNRKMLNFYTRLFVRMYEYFLTPLMVVLTFLFFVLIWRFTQGYYPGSTVVVEDPPIAHNGLDPKQARFMFFYTNWCPYSHKAQAPWRSFKQQLKNAPALYGGKEVLFEEINAEADKGKAALYTVREYPTFKLETTDRVFVMKGKPDIIAFDNFLQNNLGEKTFHKGPAS